MKTWQLFINNEWVDAENGEVFETYNPATGEKVSRLAKATQNDVDRAAAAAKAASEEWAALYPEKRGEYMLKAAQLIGERAEEFARIESAETGKTLNECLKIDIPFAARAFEYYGKLMTGFAGQLIEVPQNNILDYVTYEPYGVAAVISPWNFPIHLMTRGMCPALAAGNCVVVKASSKTPTTTSMLGEIALAAGFPTGVINIISGPGGSTGNAMMANKDIEVLSFTGSLEVGRELTRRNADSPIIKKLILELGGKGAIIVDRDCDIEGALNSALFGVCFNQGEVCCASSRLYVHEAIYDEFMDKLVRKFNSLIIGMPNDPTTHIGSLIDKEAQTNVDGFVKRARAEGAKVLCGGKPFDQGEFAKGAFYMPTILANVTEDMECMQEEIFGPVVCATKIQDIDEGIEKANSSAYGLGAAIWSENPRTLYWAGKRLKAGTVWQNYNVTSTLEAPYGGIKNSGIGRDDGPHGMYEFMRVKNNMQFVGKEYDNFWELPKMD
ncbi:MAG: aldehyde dehydrogenase family protein [Clostridia bacterium]